MNVLTIINNCCYYCKKNINIFNITLLNKIFIRHETMYLFMKASWIISLHCHKGEVTTQGLMKTIRHGRHAVIRKQCHQKRNFQRKLIQEREILKRIKKKMKKLERIFWLQGDESKSYWIKRRRKCTVDRRKCEPSCFQTG